MNLTRELQRAPGAVPQPPLVPARLRHRAGWNRRGFAAGPRSRREDARRRRIRCAPEAALRGQGEAGDLHLHGRRTEPPGAVRQQAAARQARRQAAPAELLKGYRAAFINPELRAPGPEVQVRQARAMRHGAERAPAAHRQDRRRHLPIGTMQTDAFNHAPAQIMMNTGSQQFGRPSFGSWTLYGLGSESADLPGFVVLPAPRAPAAAPATGAAASCRPSTAACRSAAPATRCSTCRIPAGSTCETQRELARRLNRLNDLAAAVDRRPGDRHPHQSFEMAYQLQSSAPELMDLSKESPQTLEMYGVKPGKDASFASNCLLARRLVERGVRFVQLFHEAWDQHGNLTAGRQAELPRHRPGLRRAGDGSQAARAARRHARHLGRRVRPHADGPGRQRRPRPPQSLLHDLAGRRRHASRASPTARPTISASTSSPTRSTSTTCTPRCSTCWASTTPGSPTASRAATSA